MTLEPYNRKYWLGLKAKLQSERKELLEELAMNLNELQTTLIRGKVCIIDEILTREHCEQGNYE